MIYFFAAAIVALVIIFIHQSAPHSLYLGGYVAAPTPEIAARPDRIPIWIWFIPSGLGTLLGAALGLGGVAIAAYYAFKRQADLQRKAFATQAQQDRDRITEEHLQEARAIANALAAEFEVTAKLTVMTACNLHIAQLGPAGLAVESISTEVYRGTIGRIGLLEPYLAKEVVAAIGAMQPLTRRFDAQNVPADLEATCNNLARLLFRLAWRLTAFALGEADDLEEAERWSLNQFMEVEAVCAAQGGEPA